MYYIIVLGIFTFSAGAFEKPQCSPPSYLVEYVSPIDGKNIFFCQQGRQKNGLEFVYSKDGKLLEKKQYRDGKEVELVTPPLPKKKTKENEIIDFAVTYQSIAGGNNKLPQRLCGCQLYANGEVKCFGKYCGYSDKLSLVATIPGSKKLSLHWFTDRFKYLHISCVAGKETICWIDKNKLQLLRTMLFSFEIKNKFTKKKKSNPFLFFNLMANNINSMNVPDFDMSIGYMFCGEQVEMRYKPGTLKCSNRAGPSELRRNGLQAFHNKNCQKIDSGLGNNYFLSNDGNLNYFESSVKCPTFEISDFKLIQTGVKDFSSSYWGKVCFVLNDGTFKCLGSSKKNTTKFNQSIKFLKNVKKISIGEGSGCVLTKDGEIFCSAHVGRDPFYQIMVPEAKLLAVVKTEVILGVACSIAKSDERVYCWWPSESGNSKIFHPY